MGNMKTTDLADIIHDIVDLCRQYDIKDSDESAEVIDRVFTKLNAYIEKENADPTKPDVNHIAPGHKADPRNMDAVVEQLFCIYRMRYEEEMQWRLRSMLERAYKAGKVAAFDEVQKHACHCLKCGDCDELDTVAPEIDQ